MDSAAPNPSPNKRKDRKAGSDDIDGILSSITNKLALLSTVGQSQNSNHSVDSEPDRIYLTSVFADVLQCGEQEAMFYLETAQWDLVSAINLCLETGLSQQQQHQYAKKNRNEGAGSSSSDSYGCGFGSSSSSSNKIVNWVAFTSQPKKYLPLTVKIEGLPENWVCKVNEFTGALEFTHLDSGHVQSCVPPFFADAPDDAELAVLASISEQQLGIEAELNETVGDMMG